MRKKRFANEDKTVFNQRTASSSCPSTPFPNLPKIIQGCLLLPAFLPLCLSSPIFSLLAGPAALPADAAAAAAAAAAGNAVGVLEFLMHEHLCFILIPHLKQLVVAL